VSEAEISNRIPEESPAPDRSSRRRRIALALCGSGLLLALIVTFLPGILAASPYRNVLIQGSAHPHNLEGSSRSASAAWWSTIRVNGLTLRRTDETLNIDVDEIVTERTLFDLLLVRPDIGLVTLERPTVRLQIPDRLKTGEGEPEFDPVLAQRPVPDLSCVVRHGAIVIHSSAGSDPVVAIDDLSLTARAEHGPVGPELVVAPTVLFDRRTLTPELCNQGLQLVAPVLADAAFITGDMTVELDEFRIPLQKMPSAERNRRMRIAGRVRLHDVETGLKNPVLAAVAELIATVTGNRQVEVIRVADETLVEFQVEDGRVHHEGLTLVIPEISDELLIRTRGTVGLDETIDIQVTINLPARVTARIPVLGSLTQAPLELTLTGTLSNPRVSLPAGRDILDELANRLTSPNGESPDQPAPTLSGAIGTVVDGLNADRTGKPDIEKTARGIFDIIRATRDQKKKSSTPAAESAEPVPNGNR